MNWITVLNRSFYIEIKDCYIVEINFCMVISFASFCTYCHTECLLKTPTYCEKKIMIIVYYYVLWVPAFYREIISNLM